MYIVPLLLHLVNVNLRAAGSAAFFRRPVWEQTIGKQSNERPFQKNSAVPDASGKTFRKSVRSSINLLQPSPGVRYSEFLTLSILRVKNSLPLTVSADTTTPRSLSLETRPLISCLRYASPNRRPGDCKIGVGLDKWGHTRPFICQHILFNTSHGDKVRNEVRLHFSKGSDGVTSKIGATSVAPKKESNLISVLNRWPHRFALLSWGHE